MKNQWRTICNLLGVKLFFEQVYIKCDVKFDKNQKKDGPINLVYVGRLVDKQKNIRFLVELFEALKAKSICFTLNIIGDGPDRDLLGPLKSQSEVVFHGYLGAEDRDVILESQDILIMPSHSEGFGLVLIEAGYCGVMPLVNDLPHIYEILPTKDNILPVSEVDLWVSAIKYYAEDRCSLRKKQLSYRQFVLSRFGDDVSASKQYVEIVNNVQLVEKSSVNKFFCFCANFVESLPGFIRWRVLRLVYYLVSRSF